ncbi:MAG: hypothetical protein ABJA98_07125 [Acidobacteriota bacterium]
MAPTRQLVFHGLGDEATPVAFQAVDALYQVSVQGDGDALGCTHIIEV